MMSGDTIRALERYRSAAALATTSDGQKAIWEIADYFRARHDADSAVAWYARAAATADSTAPLALLRTGEVYLGNERWAEALDALNRVAANPATRADWIGSAYLGIAEINARQGDRQRAREILGRLIRDHAGGEISRRAEEQLKALGNL